MNSNRKHTLLALAAVMGLGLFAAGTAPAEAHNSGKKKGWHKKRGHKKDYRGSGNYRYRNNEYYGDSYRGDWVHRGRDIDGDGIPNDRDRDIDGDGHPNYRDHKPYGSGYEGRQSNYRGRRR